ncbi:Sensor kinase CusS [Phycisphaerae bacterium RAS1]|nr:Sensor kinase CusS [Phycisphaerae bacterium RAS1]
MRPSIRRRLAALTALTATAVVALAAAFVWWRMNRVLLAELDGALGTEARALAARVENEHGGLGLDLPTGSLADAGLGGEVLARISTADGRVLFCSDALKRGAAEPRSSAAISPDPGGRYFDLLVESAGDFRAVELHVLVKRDPEDDPDAETAEPLPATVMVARPLAPLRQTLRELALTLAGAAVLSAIAALLAARHVAHRGVAPISVVAARIGEADPNGPPLALDPRRVPEELDPVVAKTNELLARVQSELNRQRQLTADVAHDLRTPIAGVRVLLDVCLQKQRDAAEYAETLSTARDALRRLSGWLEDVLIIARLDAAAEKPILSPVCVADVVEEAAAMLRPLAAAHHVRVTTDDVDGAAIFSDRGKLTKIVANLLANAIEHSPAGGAVRVECHAAPGDGCRIRVQDDGPGIPAEMRETVFDRFVRGDVARVGNGHHGLGLPIARGLARLLGGEVSVDPNASGGVLVVTLPRGRGDSGSEGTRD